MSCSVKFCDFKWWATTLKTNTYEPMVGLYTVTNEDNNNYNEYRTRKNNVCEHLKVAGSGEV